MGSLTSSILAYDESQVSYIKALKFAQSQKVSIGFSNFIGLHNGAQMLYLS